MYKINGNPEQFADLGVFHKLSKQFLPYAHKKLGFDKPVGINLLSDPNNAKDPLGKTAYYDPNKMEVTVFVDKRHVKDILRSMSHELVHHTQNCRGEFEGGVHTGPGYAQEDGHMRKMEEEAYLRGQMLLRDFEDNLKNSNLKENQAMGIKRNKLKNIKEGVAQHYVKTSPEGAKRTTFTGLSPKAAEIPDKALDKLKLKRKNPEKVSLPPKKKLELSEEDKPDYPDIDKDGDREESMKQAAKDKKAGGLAEEEGDEGKGKLCSKCKKLICEPHCGGKRDKDLNEDDDKEPDDKKKKAKKTQKGGMTIDDVPGAGVDNKPEDVTMEGETPAMKIKPRTKAEKEKEAKVKKSVEDKTIVGKFKNMGPDDVKKENWTRKNKDELLFERLVKKWCK
jgi:hypothetical protein